jgi:glycosyltransferase involved in cell wall biosynthesis
MKIIINTASTNFGGSVQVAKSFIDECRQITDNEYHIVLGETIGRLIENSEFPPNFYFYRIKYRPATKVFSFQDQSIFFKEIEKKIKPDVVFTTSGPSYWRPIAPHLMGFNLPHYLYQDSPFFLKISTIKKLKWKLKGLIIKFYSKRDADAFVVQTNDVNERLKKWINSENVYTVTNTYGNQFNEYENKNNQNLFLPLKKEGEFRLILLSTYYFHKNFQIINKIIDNFNENQKNNIRFVLTLSNSDFEAVITEENRKYVYNVGVLIPDDCPKLYIESDAVFLPTLLECFSATYAEGMKMGLPIITTDLSFAHTVCGKAAVYYSPLDAKDAARKIILIKNDIKLKSRLIENGKLQLNQFNSSKRRAKMFLDICKELIKKE